jgi:hypothetical protein
MRTFNPMTDSRRPAITECRLPSSKVRSLLTLSLLFITAGSICGCGEGGSSVSVSGQVSQDGVRTPAEIQIEQLNADGNRVGRSVTAYADEQGEFSASIAPSAGVSRPLECRLVVRVSKVSSRGLPTALDENARPEKATRLRRVIRNNDSLNLLLTR